MPPLEPVNLGAVLLTALCNPAVVVVAVAVPAAHFTSTAAFANATPSAAVPDTSRLAAGGALPPPPPQLATRTVTASAAIERRFLDFM